MRTHLSLALCLLFSCAPAAQLPLASTPPTAPEARVVPVRVAPRSESIEVTPPPVIVPRAAEALEGFVPSAEQRGAWPYEPSYETEPPAPTAVTPRPGVITGSILEDGPDEEEMVACIKRGSCPPTDTGKVRQMAARKFQCAPYRVIAIPKSELELALSGTLEIATDESSASIVVSPKNGVLFAASGCEHAGTVACVQVSRTVKTVDASYQNKADRLCFWTTTWGAPAPADGDAP